jgi:hypothetical protein
MKGLPGRYLERTPMFQLKGEHALPQNAIVTYVETHPTLMSAAHMGQK